MWEDKNGNPLKLKVVGVFRPLDESELYWEPVKEEFAGQVYATERAFQNHFLGEGVESLYSLYGSWNFIWDYKTLEITEVSGIMYNMTRMEKV